MRRTQSALLMAVGAGGALMGWLELFRRSRQSRCLTVSERLPGSVEELFDRLRDVEAEPRLVPGVHSVTVLERDEVSVRYRVEGRAYGVPWWAVFRKEWEGAPNTLTWESDDGTFDMRQVGQLRLEEDGGATLATVVACTHFDAPVVGPLATLTCGPCYLKGAFRAWLRNAGRAQASRREWEQLRAPQLVVEEG